MRDRSILVGVLGAALLAACGGEEFEPGSTTGGEGGGTGSTTASSTSSTTSTGGGCRPGETEDCYSGPDGTDGVGPCHAGTRTCGGDGTFGDCLGEAVPGSEDCAAPGDEDCDGQVDEADAGCVCAPSAVEPCYSGPAGTAGVGVCAEGSRTCEATGTAWGACADEVVPSAELCAEPGDEDCDGSGCSDAIWSDSFGDASPQAPASVAVDAQGNVYVAGRFAGALALGGATLISAGGEDVFLAKFDPTGAHVWSKQFGFASTQRATGVAIGPQGEVFLVGNFGGSIDLGGGTLTSADGFDVFLAKLTADGNHVWSIKLGSTGAQEVSGVAVDANGDPVIAGSFDGQMDLCLSPPCAWQSKGGKDIFLLKRSGVDGATVWSGYFGDALEQTASAVAVDPLGNVAITGKHAGTINFGGMFGQPCDGLDAYVARFNAQGGLSWFQRYGDAAVQEATAVAMDAVGNVAAAGNFAGTTDFGAGALPSAGGSDVFVVMLNAGGAHVWSQGFGSVANEAARGLALDAQGDVVVTGDFAGDIDAGGAPLVKTSDLDVFLVKLAGADGSHLWSKDFGITGSSSAAAVATGPAREIALAGTTTGTVDLGTGTLATLGQTDIIVGTFSP